MPKSYSLEEKLRAYVYYSELMEERQTIVDGQKIRSVKSLAEALKVHHSSIYNWVKEIERRRDIYGDTQVFEEIQKAIENTQNKNAFFKNESITITPKKALSIKDFDGYVITAKTRFLGSLCSIFGVEGYSKIRTESMFFLKLGLRLLKLSGLVQSDAINQLNGDYKK